MLKCTVFKFQTPTEYLSLKTKCRKLFAHTRQKENTKRFSMIRFPYSSHAYMIGTVENPHLRFLNGIELACVQHVNNFPEKCRDF